MTRIRIGISTCPNDTFAFHGLLAGEVQAEGLDLEFSLHDVEELNVRLHAGELDVAKVSFHAALAHAQDVLVLPSGSALGYGVGPLLLGSGRPTSEPRPRVLCPGKWTTAHLLWRLFHDGEGDVEQVVFSDIFPALQRGTADLGVCIHEGRFTWEEAGLAFREDLGATWESATGQPLPLGGIVARRALGEPMARRIQRAIHASVTWGQEHRERCLPSMRAHAQEMADDVLWSHVDLYVNETTVALGAAGRDAIHALGELARERGLIGPGVALEVLDDGLERERLFHLMPSRAWEAWESSAPDAEHRPATFGDEGFVHLSFAEQLEGTLAAHFQEDSALVLLELDAATIAAETRLERTRGNAWFPHLMRPIRRREVREAWLLEPGPPAERLRVIVA